jgi:hypothetical protein
MKELQRTNPEPSDSRQILAFLTGGAQNDSGEMKLFSNF